MVKPSLKLKKDSLQRIKDRALDNIKSACSTRDLNEVFLSACWTESVISELNRLKLFDLDFTLTPDNIKMGEED